ncbi:hypothetical protein FRC06_000934, partial [Ceratobasidium sp. 370]
LHREMEPAPSSNPVDVFGSVEPPRTLNPEISSSTLAKVATARPKRRHFSHQLASYRLTLAESAGPAQRGR